VFLQQQLESKPGPIVRIPGDHAKLRAHAGLQGREAARPIVWAPEDGTPVGTHPGAHFFTVGQRKGIAVGGHAEPLFVLDRDVNSNTLYVGMGDQHPGLYRSALWVEGEELHAVREDQKLHIGKTRTDFCVRFRYRQPLEPATLTRFEEGLLVSFYRPQRGIASGQFAAWYAGEEVIGSGPIAW
jgi:tRNA-specific 2-thiouridylase